MNNQLTLTPTQYITFESFKSFEQMLPLYDAKVVLHIENKNYILADESIKDVLTTLCFTLQKCLHNMLSLDNSINQDIGLMWNNFLHEDGEFVYEGQFWIGLKYSVWQAPSNVHPCLATWLYNDQQGNIIIEITENYFWHYTEPDGDARYISYQQFIQQYQPLLKHTLQHNVAEQWLQQAKSWLNMLEENEKSYLQNS
jgi:hypothetical protein